MANLPKIALGAWAWGNDGTFGNNLTAESLKPVFDTAMENGLNLWDTAYAYGMGTSEKVLAGFLKGLPRESYLISDKFTPQCADASSASAMKDMIEMQLGLMDLDRFDVYWIHNVSGAPKWTEELAKYFEGKDNVPLLGVSNHNLAEIITALSTDRQKIPESLIIARKMISTSLHIWFLSREHYPASMIRSIPCRKDQQGLRPITLYLINWKSLMQSLGSWLINIV